MTGSRDGRDLLAAVGVGVLMVLCCAGPVLLASGALAGVGALMRGWWLVGAAVSLAGVASVAVLVRRRRRGADDTCCPPPLDAGRQPLDKDAPLEPRLSA